MKMATLAARRSIADCKAGTSQEDQARPSLALSPFLDIIGRVIAVGSCRIGLDRRSAGCGQDPPCWNDPGFRP
jgi:hypothetical protein